MLNESLRTYRRGRVGQSWYGTETYLKGKGRGVYLCQAIDRNGHLVDVFLSERQDQAAAEAFFRSARMVTDRISPPGSRPMGMASTPAQCKRKLEEGITQRTKW